MSGVSSGQPSVEYGQSCEENHVSSTSGSWTSSTDPHSAHAVGSSTDATWCPFAQYHTGMRCPHHSCREMFQSRRLSSHCVYARSHRRGQNVMRPSSAASFAELFSGSTFTNHCWPLIH